MEQEKNKTKQDDKKNKDFIQLYRNQIDNVADLALANASAYKLFMFLLKNMDGGNALCVSNSALQEILGCGKATICRAVKYLKDEGWICVLKSSTTNVYIVNPDIAWTSYGYQKQYCKFTTNVILSGTENAEYLDNPKASMKFKTISDDFIKTVQANRKKALEGFVEINQVEG